MQHGLNIGFSIKSVSEDGVFTGYAATFNNADLGRDVMLPGAFTESLRARPADKVKMLRSHDASEPIGIWSEIKEDQNGLLAMGRLILDTTKGRETYSLLKAGALDALSVGYQTKSQRFDPERKIRLLEKVELWEISVVTFPMNPRASIAAVKQNDFSAAELAATLSRATAALRGQGGRP